MKAFADDNVDVTQKLKKVLGRMKNIIPSFNHQGPILLR